MESFSLASPDVLIDIDCCSRETLVCMSCSALSRRVTNYILTLMFNDLLPKKKKIDGEQNTSLIDYGVLTKFPKM